MQKIVLFFCLTFSSLACANTLIQPIPKSIQQQMIGTTWQASCPIRINQLRYLSISYWGFDNQSHQGHLIVHRKTSKQVSKIFAKLYAKHFPIEKMQIMAKYAGDDRQSMQDNNTSAFNCRKITGDSQYFSKHSYGLAIDINPRLNPHIEAGKVLPATGENYVDRKQQIPGMIHHDDPVYQLFRQHRWAWGGDWQNLKDYQHFEK